jgi:SAM-dependent methyltransferase
MPEDYEYRGMMAQAWDLLRGDTSTWPDRLYWRVLIERDGEPALDVGCGTGRLLLDYRASGLDVDGVDNSPEMLALCREKALAAGIDVEGRLFEQPMETLSVPRRYATIFVPSLSFQLLMAPGAADKAMTRFFDHLRPGGILALSFRSRFWSRRNPPAQMQWSDWTVLAEAPRPDGLVFRRWYRERFDLVAQFQYEENRYELLRDGAVVETEFHARVPSVCWHTQTQALGFFERAGFTDLKITTRDSFDPAGPDDSLFKIIGVRPS